MKAPSLLVQRNKPGYAPVEADGPSALASMVGYRRRVVALLIFIAVVLVALTHDYARRVAGRRR
jgi:hypothetical protein